MTADEGLTYWVADIHTDPALIELPGMRSFIHFCSLYGGTWPVPIDRTHTITTPIRSHSLFPIPTFRPFTKSYEDICNDRAIELLAHAEKLGAPMYVMYSGGIDSTCVVVSLLKHATPEQKKHIVILLSQDSITENPRFYDEHLKSNFRLESSIGFAKHLGGEVILLSAELNDQLLGANAVRDVIINYGSTFIHAPYDRERIVAFYSRCLGGNASEAYHFVTLFEGLRDTASIPIHTNLDFLWWINFTTKWQACLLYVLLFTPPENTARITPDYLRDRFISFFNTDDFQLWSMNNLDKRIKDTWKTYKWVAKDVIYAFNKDTEYRDHKTKRRSRPHILPEYALQYKFLDPVLRLTNDAHIERYLVQNNDFVDATRFLREHDE